VIPPPKHPKLRVLAKHGAPAAPAPCTHRADGAVCVACPSDEVSRSTDDGLRITGVDGAAPIRVTSPDIAVGWKPELLAELVTNPALRDSAPTRDYVARALDGDLSVAGAAMLRRDLEAALALLVRRRGLPGERLAAEFLKRWRDEPPPPVPRRGAVRTIAVQITDAYGMRYAISVSTAAAHAKYAAELIRDAAEDCHWTIDDLHPVQIEHKP